MDVDHNNLHLIEPTARYIDSYRAAISEYRKHNVYDFAYPKVGTRRDVARFLRDVDNTRRGLGVKSGYVPSSAFWLVDGRHYLGSGDVRHFLNDSLRKLGGNIGYSIRPAAWRQGLGTLQLALLLGEAAKLRVAKPIITCFDENTASAKVIEANGGVLIKRSNVNNRGKNRLTRVYEIDLTRRPEYDMMYRRGVSISPTANEIEKSDCRRE